MASQNSVALTNKPPAVLRAERLNLASPAQVGEALKILFGSFPLGKPNDPQIYTAAVTQLLSNYPNSVVRKAVDPIRGIASRTKFLPTIAELSELLDCELAREIRENKPRESGEPQRQISDEERERVKQKFAKLSSELGTGMRTFVK